MALLVTVSPAWVLRRSPTLRTAFLACLWRPVLPLTCTLLRVRLRLLPLILDCRASPLTRGFRWDRPLNAFVSPVWRLRVGGGWRVLLDRRWWVGTLDIVLLGTSLLGRSLPSPVRRRGSRLHGLLRYR